jgi:hypothetical protein
MMMMMMVVVMMIETIFKLSSLHLEHDLWGTKPM